jgi:hypothetical protein
MTHRAKGRRGFVIFRFQPTWRLASSPTCFTEDRYAARLIARDRVASGDSLFTGML